MRFKKSFAVSLSVIALMIFSQSSFANENSNDQGLWCVKDNKSGNITIVKNGSIVTKKSKEYATLLKKCQDRIKKDEEYARSFN